MRPGFYNQPFFSYVDKSGYLLCGIRPFQCGVGNTVPGEMEAKGSRTGIQVGNAGHPHRVTRGTPSTVSGMLRTFLHDLILFKVIDGRLCPKINMLIWC